MNYELGIVPGTGIALFRRTESVTVPTRISQARMVSRFCKENNLSLLIVDVSEEEVTASTMEMFSFAQKIPGLMRGIKIALVCKADDDMVQFAENVAANRGTRCHAFSTREEARAWLEDETPAEGAP